MGNGGLSVRIRGGKLGNVSRLLDLAVPHVTRSALVIQGGVQAASPRREGTLQRSFTTRPARVSRVRVISQIGTPVPYAHYQNTRTRNKGYIRRGIDARKAQAIKVLRDGIKADIGKLWVK